MTTFFRKTKTGKIEEVNLMLSCSPHIIRAVVDGQGKPLDALDREEDAPRIGETLALYRLRSVIGFMTLSNKKHIQIAEYELHDTQPSQSTMSNFIEWTKFKNSFK